MDIYVFGSHDGDLPTHLVSEQKGNRIRGMARLQDGEYDVFYALEAESDEEVDRHVEAISSAGSRPSLVLRPHSDWVKSGPITIPNIPQPPKPMWIPPLEWLLFLLVRVERLEGFVVSLIERLGDGNVGVWMAEDGRLVVEATADRRDDLEAALAAATDGGGASDANAHYASSDGVTRRT